MSQPHAHAENFKDSTSAINVIMIFTAMLCCALLPMLMGWFTLLR
jgi:hypothetical protein